MEAYIFSYDEEKALQKQFARLKWDEHVPLFPRLHLLFHSGAYMPFVMENKKICFMAMIVSSQQERARRRLAETLLPRPIDDLDDFYAHYRPTDKCISFICLKEPEILQYPSEDRLDKDLPILYIRWQSKTWDDYFLRPEVPKKAFRALMTQVCRAVMKSRKPLIIRDCVERVLANRPLLHEALENREAERPEEEEHELQQNDDEPGPQQAASHQQVLEPQQQALEPQQQELEPQQQQPDPQHTSASEQAREFESERDSESEEEQESEQEEEEEIELGGFFDSDVEGRVVNREPEEAIYLSDDEADEQTAENEKKEKSQRPENVTVQPQQPNGAGSRREEEDEDALKTVKRSKVFAVMKRKNLRRSNRIKNLGTLLERMNLRKRPQKNKPKNSCCPGCNV